MRAIRVAAHGGPEVLRIEEVGDPAPGPGEVVLRIAAAGVNPVEAYLRAGTHSRAPTLPWTPGSDGAGNVEAVGPDVRDLAPGDRVYTAGSLSGTYAERALCRADQVHALPERLSFAEGAGIHVPYATAWRALHGKARARAGEVLLVHGATGGVGIAAVQMGLATGMTVVATGGSERGRELARAQGAHVVLDHGVPGHLDGIPALTGGRAPDVILENLADRNLEGDLRAAAPFARIVVVGSRGRIEIDPRDAMTRDLTVMGISLFNLAREELAAIHGEIGKGLAAGILRPVVGREFPLAEAPAAHAALMEPGARGKLVLIP